MSDEELTQADFEALGQEEEQHSQEQDDAELPDDQEDDEEGEREAATADDEGDGDEPEHTGFKKRISTLTARNRKMHEENEALRQQLAAKGKVEKAVEEKEPEIPDFPDEDLKYDNPAEYQRLLKIRDEAIVDRAEWKAMRRLSQQQQEDAKTQQVREAKVQQAKIVDAYIENGVDQGVSEQRMQKNEQVLREVGVNGDLALFLYSDDSGARLVDYLANNVDELEKLNAMPPTQAAVRIATVIKPKALAKKPHVTKAPDPAKPSRGTSRRETVWDKVGAGATFE
jgi:hypothetical protein